jgi:DNA-binding MarR family transcriptional regulator
VEDLIAATRSLQSELNRAETSSYAKEHLSPAAARVIVLLHGSGALSVPYIGRAVGTSRQNIQMVINRLRRAGVVTAELNPHHKRSSRIVLTERGEQLHQFIVSRQNKLFRSVLEGVSEEELRTATRCLRTLAAQLNPAAAQKQPPAPRPRKNQPSSRVNSPPSPLADPERLPPLEEEERPLSLL